MHRALIIDPDAEIYAQEIKRLNIEGLDWVAASSVVQAQAHMASVEIALGRPDLVAGLLPSAKRLAWVQSTYAGVEALCATNLRRDYRLTGVKEIFGPLISEYVLAYVLALERSIFHLHDQQRQKKWRNIPYRGLAEVTMGIAGLGSIGRHLAGTAAHFGMRVLGLKRTAGAVDHVATVFTLDEMDQFLKPLDYLVLTLPDTPDTQRLIDARALGYLKSSAVLINVRRGSTVDQDALTAALLAGTIKGAVLDVFATEPLPPSSVLWTMPNVYITPHNAAFSFPRQICALFAENYRRFAAGQSLRYAVDFERGY